MSARRAHGRLTGTNWPVFCNHKTGNLLHQVAGKTRNVEIGQKWKVRPACDQALIKTGIHMHMSEAECKVRDVRKCPETTWEPNQNAMPVAPGLYRHRLLHMICSALETIALAPALLLRALIDMDVIKILIYKFHENVESDYTHYKHEAREKLRPPVFPEAVNLKDGVQGWLQRHCDLVRKSWLCIVREDKKGLTRLIMHKFVIRPQPLNDDFSVPR